MHVTINETTPSQHAVAKAAAIVVITDAKGRKLTLKKPGVLAEYDLIEALGETAQNSTYVGMVLPLIYVTAIDGEDASPPISKPQVRALIQRLGDDGVKAVMKAVQENFVTADVDGDTAAIKK
jgi:hypothetical protein